MSRSLTLFVLAALTWIFCLLGLAWFAEVWLGRALSVWGWLLLGALVTLLSGWALRHYRLRHRRRMQDMRDSALW